jgi:hypothetical protein
MRKLASSRKTDQRHVAQCPRDDQQFGTGADQVSRRRLRIALTEGQLDAGLQAARSPERGPTAAGTRGQAAIGAVQIASQAQCGARSRAGSPLREPRVQAIGHRPSAGSPSRRRMVLRSATEHHRPEQATPNRLVQQHAATFIAETEAAPGADLPQFGHQAMGTSPHLREHPFPGVHATAAAG